MNLKKSVLSFMAAGTMLVGGFTGVMAQALDSAGTELNVKVTTTGMFDIQFCGGTTEAVGPGNGAVADGNFGTVSLTSDINSSPSVSAYVIMCYTDSQSQRAGFDSTLQSSDFDNGSDTISASNLKPGKLGIMNSGQWDGQGGVVGEISALTGAGNTAVTNHTGQTTWAGGNLSGSGVKIHTAYEGAGTAGTKYLSATDPTTGNPFLYDSRSSAGSWQEMELILKVPAGTAAGEYEADLTITVNPGGL